jgi:hypothetical protein
MLRHIAREVWRYQRCNSDKKENKANNGPQNTENKTNNGPENTENKTNNDPQNTEQKSNVWTNNMKLIKIRGWTLIACKSLK